MKSVALIMASLVTFVTSQHLTELMFNMTNDLGCAENQTFTRYPKERVCCDSFSMSDLGNGELPPNVCILESFLSDKSAPVPRCACDLG